MEIFPTRTDDASLRSYVELFRICFPASTHYSLAYLRWLYGENPSGTVVGFDAYEGDILAAHYACIPATVSLRGEDVPALLSLNTATHPKFQGKGLFSKLAEQTYQAGFNNGAMLVYGVANQNSIRGFSGRLGFQDVTALDARIGVGGIRSNLLDDEPFAGFMRHWRPADVKWRLGNPANPLALAKSIGGATVVSGRTGYPLIRVVCEVEPGVRAVVDAKELRLAPIVHLTLGLLPAKSRRTSVSVSIPGRLRPSPLRLIYRNLRTSTDRIEPDSVLLRFIDFDAY